MTVAAGDAIASASVSISAGSSVLIQPSSGIEWTIFNIYVPTSSTVELYRTDGTNPILIDSSAAGGFFNNYFRCTNASYITVKNTGATTIYMYYDGTVTKSS